MRTSLLKVHAHTLHRLHRKTGCEVKTGIHIHNKYHNNAIYILIRNALTNKV